MFLKLRIIFTVLSALCLVVIIPATVWGGWLWLGILGVGALLFFGLMLLCKQEQEKRERKDEPPSADYFNPDKKDEK